MLTEGVSDLPRHKSLRISGDFSVWRHDRMGAFSKQQKK